MSVLKWVLNARAQLRRRGRSDRWRLLK